MINLGVAPHSQIGKLINHHGTNRLRLVCQSGAVQVLVNGVLAVESLVLPELEQRALMETNGLKVTRVIDVPVGSLLGPRSPKLDVLPGGDSPVVTGYLATRPA